MKSTLALSAFLAAVAASAPSFGSCGLHFCPRPEAVPEASAWTLGGTFNQAGFDFDGVHGTYSEVVTDVRFMWKQVFIADLHVPFLALSVDAKTTLGFANPLALVEYRMHPGSHQMLGFGAQAELPLGDAEAGLAQDHFMVMPYGSWSGSMGRFFLSGTSGVSMAMDHSHEHASGEAALEPGIHAGHIDSHGSGTPLYVHPHEDFEWSYRASAGMAVWNTRIHPETYLSGQHVLSEMADPDLPRDYLTLGFSAPFQTGRMVLTPNLEFPISTGHRFEWTMGMGVGVGL